MADDLELVDALFLLDDLEDAVDMVGAGGSHPLGHDLLGGAVLVHGPLQLQRVYVDGTLVHVVLQIFLRELPPVRYRGRLHPHRIVLLHLHVLQIQPTELLVHVSLDIGDRLLGAAEGLVEAFFAFDLGEGDRFLDPLTTEAVPDLLELHQRLIFLTAQLLLTELLLLVVFFVAVRDAEVGVVALIGGFFDQGEASLGFLQALIFHKSALFFAQERLWVGDLLVFGVEHLAHLVGDAFEDVEVVEGDLQEGPLQVRLRLAEHLEHKPLRLLHQHPLLHPAQLNYVLPVVEEGEGGEHLPLADLLEGLALEVVDVAEERAQVLDGHLHHPTDPTRVQFLLRRARR
mmetsp:Transcript_23179/g.22657  ORF Transcript_23179/g.22657 Transcript_23179/m.22657 type:complete len:344 (+) Transcript_23179:3015-4046(+)